MSLRLHLEDQHLHHLPVLYPSAWNFSGRNEYVEGVLQHCNRPRIVCLHCTAYISTRTSYQVIYPRKSRLSEMADAYSPYVASIHVDHESLQA